MTARRTRAKDLPVDADEPEPTEQEMDAFRRRVHDFLSFWRVCDLKRCRRGRGCRGPTRACAERHFPLLPEEAMVWLHRAFEARCGGATPREAAGLAQRQTAAWSEAMARLDARQAKLAAERTAAPAAPAAQPAPSQAAASGAKPARVRLL